MNDFFTTSLFSTSSLSCFVIGAASVLMYVLHKNRSFSRKTNLKTPWPEVAGRRPFLGNSIGSIENLGNAVEAWAEIYGKDGIFSMELFGTKFYAVCDDKHASFLENKMPFSITRREGLVRAMDSLGVTGVFSAIGDTWQKDRRLVGPALNRKNVREYTETVKLVANRLIQKWKGMSMSMVEADADPDGTGAILINPDIISAAMDIISLVAFGKDIDTVSKGKSHMVNVLDDLFRKITYRVAAPFHYWKIPIIGQYLDGGGFVKAQAKQYCIDHIQRFESSHSSNINSNESNKDEQEKGSKTFLGKVIALNKESEHSLSAERMVGNLLTMFAAGSETTAGTVNVALYEIANDKTGLQEELAEEARAMENYDSASLEDFTNCLPRLRSLVYEVLRLKGPVAFMGVENRDPIEIDGVQLPPNTSFFLMWRYISTREDSESRTPRGPRDTPLKDFCARRWLVDDDSKGSPMVASPTYKTGFRAFGTGRRVCPGRDLAEIEILVIISSILRNFKVSLEPGHPPMKLVSRFTQTPSEIRLCLTPV
jgi:cytochrome P450